MFDYAKPEQKKDSKDTVQKKEIEKAAFSPNLTGIPDAMKARFENLSGFSFNDVRVHYNSDKPAQLQALAYTQGNQVYVAPGMEKHLGHELGHVVQQKQGRVKPTRNINGMPVNDEPSLEREGNLLALGEIHANNTVSDFSVSGASESIHSATDTHTIQRLVPNTLPEGETVYIIRSTSRHLHGTKASIIRYLGGNQYNVRLDDGSSIIARSDQLTQDDKEFSQTETATCFGTTSTFPPKRVTIDVRMDDLKALLTQGGAGLEENAKNEIRKVVVPLKDTPFVIGGSFAIMLKAFLADKPARVPRDIDIFIESEHKESIMAELGETDMGYETREKNVKTKYVLCGIPIEFHFGGNLVETTQAEKSSGILEKNHLLQQEIKKIKSISLLKSKSNIIEILKSAGGNAGFFLEKMNAVNETIVSDTSLEEKNKEIWIKALVDIKTLISSGAQLPNVL